MKIAIDKDGFFLGYDVDNEKQIAGTAEILIDTDIVWPYPDTLLKPKWTGSEWVEGASPDDLTVHYQKQAMVTAEDETQKKLDKILKILEG